MRIIIFLSAAVFLCAAPVRAAEDFYAAPDMNSFTLEKILRHVYLYSPVLESSRDELRASHELTSQALTGWKPTLGAEASLYSSRTDSSNLSGADGAITKEVELTLSQPLYRGGRTKAATARAQELVKAQYGRLLQSEQQTMLRAATAYMNVIRDRTLLNLRIGNEEALQQELNAVNERFKAGDLTTTDRKQAEARLARAQAEHVAASGQLENSRAEFEQVVGFLPDETLYISAPPFNFPPAVEDMIRSAEEGNPALETSKRQKEAAEKDINVLFGELLPEVSAFATYNKQYDPQPGIVDDSETRTIGIRANIPLYEAGAKRSKVREAKSVASQREQEINQQRRLLREEISRNWSTLLSARQEIAARTIELEAAKAALDGVREEAKMGERTVLDILDADQDVLSAEAAKARAHRDEIVASYALAASLGWLIPEKMGMADIAYQPRSHYRAMKDKILSMDHMK